MISFTFSTQSMTVWDFFLGHNHYEKPRGCGSWVRKCPAQHLHAFLSLLNTVHELQLKIPARILSPSISFLFLLPHCFLISAQPLCTICERDCVCCLMYKAATVWEYTQFTCIWTALCVFNNMQQVNTEVHQHHERPLWVENVMYVCQQKTWHG